MQILAKMIQNSHSQFDLWCKSICIAYICTSRRWYEYSNLLFFKCDGCMEKYFRKQVNKESSKDIFLLFLSKATMNTIRRVYSSTDM